MPLLPSSTTFSGVIRLGSMNAERVLAEGVAHVLGRDLARLFRRRARLAGGHDVAQLADARVAREGERAALHELRARVGRGVVRGGAHQPAVELARPDGPVQLLRPDHPDVDHVRALVGDAARVLGGHARSREPHVAPEPNGELLDGRVLKVGEHAREGAPDPVGELLVHLLGVGAPDVICLEDRRIRHARGA